MLVSFNILKKLIIKLPTIRPKQLDEILTMSVVEVESVVDQAQRLEKTVVGVVEKVAKHPNADKLKLATVNIGNKSQDVVCGGVNLRVGMKVAFARVGALVKWHGEREFTPLESATIRGVKSNGMACSAAELGLIDDNEPEHGIMDLSYLKAKPGTSLSEALGKNDLIIEIDNKSITHRPDLWGHLGLARELAALWNTDLKIPPLANLKIAQDPKLKVEIKSPELCCRYLGVVVSGIKVQASPRWLKNSVETVGMCSINNIVDAANYVMIELGQPLHTFDLIKLSSPKIIVRRAKAGEKIKTLDEVERKLSTEMLVIADQKGPIAVAGVMGGKTSEVDEKTKNLVVESATFDAVSIRQTATKLGLRSEASARFEKALDPNLAELAIKRFVQVLQEIIPGVKVTSNLVDAYPKKAKTVVIKVAPSWINERLGTNLKINVMKDILERLGFTITGTKEWQVTVPSWRAARDVTIKEDLLEEVARIYGYSKIKPTLPAFPISPPVFDPQQDLRWRVRDELVAQGFSETLSYSFISQKNIDQIAEVYSGLALGGKELLSLQNPVDQQEQFLRPALASNLLEQLVKNVLLRSQEAISLFEIGRVFSGSKGEWPVKRGKGGKENLPLQPYHLALATRQPGKSKLEAWRSLKGMVERLGSYLGLVFELTTVGQVTKILVDKTQVGVMVVLERTRSNLKLVIGLAEFNLDLLPTDKKVKKLSALPQQPAELRDLSIIIPANILWGNIKDLISNISPLLESVDPFDVYESDSLGEGKRSIAFHLTFRSPKRTLKSEEVDKIVEQIKQALIKKFKIEIRDH